jgi:hypothetical protein
MTREFALPNPISQPNNAPVPQNLMFIGVLLCCPDPISAELCILLLEAPHFGAHACFGYCVLEDPFQSMKDLFDMINKHCGVTPLTCSASTPPPSPGWELSPLPVPSPMPAAGQFFAGGDYINSDKELMLVIAQIQCEEENTLTTSPSRPSVRDHYPSFSPLTDPPFLDVFHPTQINEVN